MAFAADEAKLAVSNIPLVQGEDTYTSNACRNPTYILARTNSWDCVATYAEKIFIITTFYKKLRKLTKIFSGGFLSLHLGCQISSPKKQHHGILLQNANKKK